jgi:hypothetical protein
LLGFGLFVGAQELDSDSFQKGAAVHDANLCAHFAQVDVLHQVLAAGLQSDSLRDHGRGFYFAFEKTHRVLQTIGFFFDGEQVQFRADGVYLALNELEASLVEVGIDLSAFY